jgi:hypothetical protein
MLASYWLGGRNMAEAPIPLAELIEELHRELAEAQEQGQDLRPPLYIEEAEIELQVIITSEHNAGARVRFWVLNADVKDKRATATASKIKLRLKLSKAYRSSAMGGETSSPVIRDTIEPPPPLRDR